MIRIFTNAGTGHTNPQAFNSISNFIFFPSLKLLFFFKFYNLLFNYIPSFSNTPDNLVR